MTSHPQRNEVKLYVVLPTNEVGGHESMLIELLTQARRYGLRPVIYCRCGWALDEMSTACGIPCIGVNYRVRSGRRSWAIRWTNFLRTLRLAQRLPRDAPVLLAPGSMHASLLHLLACALARRTIICYVPTAHGASTELLRWPKLRDWIAGVLARRVSLWIAIRDEQKSALETYWRVVTPIVTIPNRIAVMNGPPTNRANVVKSNQKLTISFIGRFEPKAKGLDWLERVLREDMHWRSRFKFVFQGRGPFLQTLERLAATIGTDHILVLPWGNPRTTLDTTDVLILTSRFEGFPLAAVEALWAGVPVVATLESGLSSILPQTCLFTFGDHLGMWRALNRMRVSRLRDEAVTHALQRLNVLLSEETNLRGIELFVRRVRTLLAPDVQNEARELSS